MITLTNNERRVLGELWNSACGNGHDFGFIEDARTAVDNPRSLGGVVSSLSKKGLIDIHDPVTTDSGTWTQFTWTGTSSGSNEGLKQAAALLGIKNI